MPRKMPEPASEPRERPPSISDKITAVPLAQAPFVTRKIEEFKERAKREKPSNSVPGVFPLKRENSNLRDWPGAGFAEMNSVRRAFVRHIGGTCALLGI